MRIALVSTEVAPFFGWGIGTYVAQAAKAWAAAGHTLFLLTPPHPDLLDRGRDILPGVTIVPVRTPEDLPGARFHCVRFSCAVLAELERLHAQSPLDYIEFPEYAGEGWASIAARRTRGALAGAVLAVKLHTPTRELRQINRQEALYEEIATVMAIEDDAIRSADLIVSPTASLLDLVRTRLAPGGASSSFPPSAVIPYPFSPDIARSELGLDGHQPAAPRTPMVLYTGRIERRKGVDLLVRAAVDLLNAGADATFRLIGKDTLTGAHQTSMLAELRGLIPPELADRFVFDDVMPRSALGPVIRSAAISCVPSRWENFPNALLEHMACGVCVVGARAGGIAEIIQDGQSGLLFEPGDHESLAQQLRTALGDAQLRARLGAAAHERVRALCDPEAFVAATIAVCAPLAGARATGKKPRPVRTEAMVLDPGVQVDAGAEAVLRAALEREPEAALAVGLPVACTDLGALLAHDVAAWPVGPVLVRAGALAGLPAGPEIAAAPSWALVCRVVALLPGVRIALVPRSLGSCRGVADGERRDSVEAARAEVIASLGWPEAASRAAKTLAGTADMARRDIDQWRAAQQTTELERKKAVDWGREVQQTLSAAVEQLEAERKKAVDWGREVQRTLSASVQQLETERKKAVDWGHECQEAANRESRHAAEQQAKLNDMLERQGAYLRDLEKRLRSTWEELEAARRTAGDTSVLIAQLQARLALADALGERRSRTIADLMQERSAERAAFETSTAAAAERERGLAGSLAAAHEDLRVLSWIRDDLHARVTAAVSRERALETRLESTAQELAAAREDVRQTQAESARRLHEQSAAFHAILTQTRRYRIVDRMHRAYHRVRGWFGFSPPAIPHPVPLPGHGGSDGAAAR